MIDLLLLTTATVCQSVPQDDQVLYGYGLIVLMPRYDVVEQLNDTEGVTSAGVEDQVEGTSGNTTDPREEEQESRISSFDGMKDPQRRSVFDAASFRQFIGTQIAFIKMMAHMGLMKGFMVWLDILQYDSVIPSFHHLMRGSNNTV